MEYLQCHNKCAGIIKSRTKYEWNTLTFTLFVVLLWELTLCLSENIYLYKKNRGNVIVNKCDISTFFGTPSPTDLQTKWKETALKFLNVSAKIISSLISFGKIEQA